MSNNRRGFIAAGVALMAMTVAACSKKTDKITNTKSETTRADIAESKAVPAPPPPPLPDTVTVSLMTAKGEIVIVLEQKKAPLTTANFLLYLDNQKLVGADFWRAANSGESGFIQATAKGPTYPPIAHEPTTQTGLSHTNGAISMSRFAPGTATADFILCVGDNRFLDAGKGGSDDKLGYAVFGHVIKGMGIVRSIMNGKIDKHTREGGWAGQMLAKPVTITAASRLTA